MEGYGWSVREVAKRADISHGTVANWINGTAHPELGKVEGLARVFGWTAAELVYGEPRRDIMNRVAELEAFRARARRLAEGISSLAGSLDEGGDLAAEPEPEEELLPSSRRTSRPRKA